MRYIDADALIKKIFPYDVVDKKDYTINAKAVADAIANTPTADVVPKSEVKRVYYNLQAVLEERAETKQEIAREIFDDIANIMVLQHGFNEKHIVAHIDFELLKELKKKYTENKE